MTPALVILAVVVAVPGVTTTLHLGVLAAASLAHRERPAPDAPPVRFLIMVPAHNEEAVLAPTLEALTGQLRTGDTVLVIADRCTDATAELARSWGAIVLERDPSSEPGRAAARQAGVAYALSLAPELWDALVMIDADSLVEPGFLAACERAAASGAEAMQARSEAVRGPRLLDHLALAASSLQGVVMPRGRDRLGLLVRLRGTGMVLSRRLVAEFRFRAPASEDLWYSMDLCLAGIRPRHVEAARLRSLNVASWADAGTQRVRYEAGRMSAAREFLGPLLRRHDAASLEAAWFLMTPPFAVAALCLILGGVLGQVAGSAAVVLGAFACLAVLGGVLAVGLVEAGAGARTWLALALAPWYLPWKAAIQVRAMLSLSRGVKTYAPTPR